MLERLRSRVSSFFNRLGEAARVLFGSVSVRVDDSSGWEPISGGGPHDRPWSDLRQDLDDALEAWRKNIFIRRLVTLTHSFAVGGGILITSKHPWVQRFITDFWTHPKNKMNDRLEPMCDELTRAGELFCVLFTNKVDGNSYIRLVPASQIREVRCADNDYETELAYGEIQGGSSELKWWISDQDPAAFKPTGGSAETLPSLPPVMLHFTVNKPIGATRGESDLTPILKWVRRYSNWLEDRVRLNRTRTRQAMLDIEIDDDSQVEKKKKQLRREDPVAAGIYVHGKGEKATLHNLEIRASDAKEDGRALRLAIVTGANSALHYTGEGESVNYATAKEMGEPTARFYTSRQQVLIRMLQHIITVAYRRKVALGQAREPRGGDLQLDASVTEVARADNLALAQAAREIVQALAQMAENGWINDETAVQLAFKFAGETIGEEKIKHILTTGQQSANTPQTPSAGQILIDVIKRQQNGRNTGVAERESYA